jgi:hypothetical protein
LPVRGTSHSTGHQIAALSAAPEPHKLPAWAEPIATAAIHTHSAPNGMTVVDGAIWVANHRGGTLQRIDPGTDTIADAVVVGGELQLPVNMFGGIWALRSARQQVRVVDPKTDHVIGSVPRKCGGT